MKKKKTKKNNKYPLIYGYDSDFNETLLSYCELVIAKYEDFFKQLEQYEKKNRS